MKKTTKVAFWAFVLVAVTSLGSVSAAPKAAAEKRPVVVALPELYIDYDPHLSYWADDADLATLAGEPLYQVDITSPLYPVVPRLAAAFPVWSDDKESLIIHLREGVKFHDGTDFNADAVVWNFERIMTLYDLGRSDWAASMLNDTTAGVNGTCRITDAVALTDYSVNITLNAPFATLTFVMSWNGFTMLSPTYYAGFEAQTFDLNVDGLMLVGTGPFVMSSMTDEEIVWLSNENYWRPSPDIKEMRWVVNDDGISRAEGLLAGDYDIAGPDPSYYDTLEEAEDIFFAEGDPGFVQYYLGFNNHLYNVTQRSAMAYAYNYTYCIDEIFGGTVARMTAIIPTGIEYGRDDLDYPTTDYAVARQLMIDMYGDEGGLLSAADAIDDQDWEDIAEGTTPFFEINHTYYEGSGLWPIVKDLLVDNFAKIGVKLTANPVASAVLSDLTNIQANHDKIGMMALGWGPDYLEAANQVSNNFFTGNSGNWLQYSNPIVDANLEESYVETDYEARRVLFDEIQQEINDDVPIIYMFRTKSYEIHTIYLSNWYGNPMTDRQTYYLAHWNPPAEDPIVVDDGIPGFAPAFLIAAMGVTALLLMKKAKK